MEVELHLNAGAKLWVLIYPVESKISLIHKMASFALHPDFHELRRSHSHRKEQFSIGF